MLPDVSIPDEITTGSPLYYISDVSLRALQKYLWSTDISDIVDKYIYNPKEAIISLRMCDFSLIKHPAESLIIGNKKTDIIVQKISNWCVMSLGSVTLNEYYGMYLDYMSTVKVKIYLPHYGFANLNIDDVMNCRILVQYKVEMYSGACVIEIYSHNNRFNTDVLIEQFTTSVLMSIPITVSDKNSIVDETINNITRTVTSPSISSIASDVVNAIDIASNKQTFTNVSQAANAHGFLANNDAYLIVTRQEAAVPSSYLSEKGFPLMATTKLSKLKGFTKVYSIEHLNIPEMTEEERNELERVLKEGVIL